jgi:4-diphosphocytidyl-2-C-methyl-D-erythritol kinase
MTLPVSWAVVLHPVVGVPTAAIFAAPELTRNTPSAKMNIFSEGYGRNDLQAAAVARYPEIAAALEVLARQSVSARMTGSGGSVFGIFPSEDQAVAARAAVAVAAPGLQGFVARTLAQHPLAAFA